MKKRIRRLLLSERGDSSYISSFVYILQPPRLEVAFCMYPRMHLIFIYNKQYRILIPFFIYYFSIGTKLSQLGTALRFTW